MNELLFLQAKFLEKIEKIHLLPEDDRQLDLFDLEEEKSEKTEDFESEGEKDVHLAKK